MAGAGKPSRETSADCGVTGEKSDVGLVVDADAPIGRSTSAFDGEDYFHPLYEVSRDPNTYR